MKVDIRPISQRFRAQCRKPSRAELDFTKYAVDASTPWAMIFRLLSAYPGRLRSVAASEVGAQGYCGRQEKKRKRGGDRAEDSPTPGPFPRPTAAPRLADSPLPLPPIPDAIGNLHRPGSTSVSAPNANGPENPPTGPKQRQAPVPLPGKHRKSRRSLSVRCGCGGGSSSSSNTDTTSSRRWRRQLSH